MVPSDRRLVVALVAVQVLFGALSVAGKIVLPFVPAFALAECRLLAAAVVLFTLERALVRSPLPPARDLARFAGFALLGVVLNQGLFLTGLAATTATNAVLLVATIPAFTLLVAMLLRQEKPRLLTFVGLAVSFGGVAVLVFAKGADYSSATLVGDAMILANSLSYSIFLVVSRPTLQRYDPLTLISWVFLFGAIEMAFVATPSLLSVDWSALDARSWFAFAYVLLGATVLSYGLNNWVLRHASASRVASFVYLQPLVGALLAWYVLGETLDARIGLAAALILAGLYVVNRVKPSARAPHAAE